MDAHQALVIRPYFVPEKGAAVRLGQRFTKWRGTQSALMALLLSFVIIALITVAVGLLVFHVLAHGYIGTVDRSFSRWLELHRSKGWNHWTYEATFVGSSIPVAVIAAVVTVLLAFRRWGRQALLLIFGLVVELAVFLTANYTVRRPRPSIRHVGATPSTFSFPSGHEAAAVVLYGGIAVIVFIATKHLLPRILVGAFATVMIVGIGISRIYRGDHFLSDVIAGLLVGVASLYAGIFVTRVVTETGLSSSGDVVPALQQNVPTELESS
ncbi:MAG TPA: phosphatase PAP2 family protein [Acidimicrobiales bacterium]